MHAPTKVVNIEINQPIIDIINLNDYMYCYAIVRQNSVPVGRVFIPVSGNVCRADDIKKIVYKELKQAIMKESLNINLFHDLKYDHSEPLVSVCVCTRDRTESLASCLKSIFDLTYSNIEIIVIDNAPESNKTKELIQNQYPQISYVCEPRPGLDWARNRAIIEARGDIIAYTDDDVIVEPGWLHGIVEVFNNNQDVMAVTGLVIPFELETEPQVLFELYGGFSRGYQRKWFKLEKNSNKPPYYIGSGILGTGSNMAFRRNLFEQIGGFDPALDVGTPTNGGGDLEIFFRLMVNGYTIVYEPRAVVRHKHRKHFNNLKTQIRNNGIGLFSYFVRSLKFFPQEKWNIIRFAVWWLIVWNIRRIILSIIRPSRFPKELIWVEFIGSITGLVRYQKAQRIAAKTSSDFKAQNGSEELHQLQMNTWKVSKNQNYEIETTQQN